MAESIMFECKEPNCKGDVIYTPEKVPIVMAIRQSYAFTNNEKPTADHFEKAVESLKSDGFIRATKEVKLICEFDHEHWYKVPKEDA